MIEGRQAIDRGSLHATRRSSWAWAAGLQSAGTLPDWLRQFLDHTAVRISLGIVAFLLILLAIHTLVRLLKRFRDASPSHRLGFLARTAYRHTARKSLQDGAYLRAADFFYSAGDYIDSAEAHLLGRNFLRAGEIFSNQKKFKRAAEAYETGGNHLRAAQLYASFGLLEKAEENYLKAGKMLAIAEMYQTAMDFPRAGKYFEKLTRYRQAADMFAKGNNFGAAARMLEQHCQHTPTAGRDRDRIKDVQEVAGQAADYYLRNSEPGKAAELLERLAMYRPAAEVLVRSEAYREAGEMYVRAGCLSEAAQAFGKAGLKERALSVQAEVYEEREEFEKAASIYRRLNKEEQAGATYEKLGDFKSAARHFFEAGKFQRAGELYARAGEYVQAGEAYEGAQDPQRAADCYRQADDTENYLRCLEKSGRYHTVGEKYFELGRLDDAASTLQRVKPKHAAFRKACFLLGKVFRNKDELALSASKFEQAIGGEGPSVKNIDIYYELAETLMMKGDDDRALHVFEQIKTVDYNYRDTLDRVEAIRSKARIPSQSGGASTDTTSRLDMVGPSALLQGRYEIIEKIGKGGMGTIFRVRDTLLDRIVAYKLLASDLSVHPQAFQSFLHEAKASASLNHPNIVHLYDIGETGGEYFLTMEYVEGVTLSSILKEKGRIPIKPAIVIVHQVCEALSYSHAQKLVHRDIKPSNIMVDDKYRVKIFDFGLAKIVEDRSFSTSKIAGTPHYMSPEQVVGESIDQRTDIYSFGVTFYHLVTGQTPFKGKDVGYHHLHTQPRSPTELCSDLPLAVDQVILRCMEKDKRNRYQSVAEIKQALKTLFG